MAFRICVIGCGGISNGCHGPSYVKYRDENPGFETAACCDINGERAAAYAEKFGFARHYTDYTEMLRVEKPDAVCVTVHEDHTARVAFGVLNMGFPMFTEKPPGKTSADTRALIEAAKKSGAINQVGYNRRYMPILQKMREMVSGGDATQAGGAGASGGNAPQAASGATALRHDGIQHIRYDFYRVGRYDADFSDTAVHGIDAVRYLTGADYVRVNFTYQDMPRYGANVKNIYMDCTMSTGAHAFLSFCPVTGAVLERATISAKDNTWIANTPIWAEGYDRPGELIHIYKNAAKAVISTAELCGESDEVYITNGFYNENRAFFDCVRNNRKSPCDLESALNTSLVKDCITNREACFILK